MNCADYIIDFLENKNNKISFGYPGGSILSLYNAISKNNCNHILARHEQGAIHMAEGYAKSTGNIGVVFATSGPGATNLVTGIANAHLDSTPLLIITGQVNLNSVGRDAFQEADILGITIPITKNNYLIKKASELPSVLEEAWELAKNGRFGPVLIDIPQNILNEEIEELPVCKKFKNIYIKTNPSEKLLKSIFSLFNKSKRPLIIVGGGVVADEGASKKLNLFAKKYSIPCVNTLMGIGGVEHKNSLGLIGIHGNKKANHCLQKADLILSIGCRFSDRVVPSPTQFIKGKKIIQVDIDSAELSKAFKSDIEVLASASDFLNSFNSYIKNNLLNSYNEWFEYCSNIKNDIEKKTKNLSASNIIDFMNDLNNNYITVTDVGKHQIMYAKRNKINFPKKFITSGGLGAMGFGIPAAIGASILTKEKVFLFVGDGGFQMTMQELSIIAKYKLPIKIFLFNNSSLELVADLQSDAYSKTNEFYSLDDNPNFSTIAAAYGINSVEIKTNEDLTKTNELVSNDLPYLFNFIL